MLYRADSDHDLTADEIDGNFRELRTDVDTLIAAGVGVGISEIDVIGDQMTFIMSDHSTQGPFTLPTAVASDRGTWAPATLYFVGDTFSINGTLYSVLFQHTSAGSFDPGANDGLGHDYYHAQFSAPANVLPAGGTDAMVLKKFGATDYVTVFDFVDVDEITGIDLTHPTNGQVFMFDSGSGDWINGDLPAPGASSFAELTGRISYQQTSGNFMENDASASGVVDLASMMNSRYVTLTENITSITCSDTDFFNASYFNEIRYIFQQDASHTVTGWNDISGVVLWDGGGSAPTMPSGAGKILIAAIYTADGGSNVRGRVIHTD